MKTLHSLFIFLFVLTTLVSCNKDEGDKLINEDITDQKIPGTDIGLGSEIRPIYGLKACPNDYSPLNYTCPEDVVYEQGKATLNWEVPSIYRTEEWFVTIYRFSASSYPDMELEVATDPRTKRKYPKTGNAIFEVARVKDTSWTDESIVPSADYNYFIFLVIEGKRDAPRNNEGWWSNGVKIRLKASTDSASSEFPSAADFWKKVKWNNLISAPAGGVGNEIYDRTRMKPGPASVGRPTGRMAVANNGGIIFASDTKNNRIVVFENSTSLSCLDDFKDDPLGYFACMIQGESLAPTAMNILGQPHDGSTLSCQEHNDVCSQYTTFCSRVSTACSTKTTASTCNDTRVDGSNDYVCGWTTTAQNPSGICVARESSCSNEAQCTIDREVPSFCRWENNSCRVRGEECLTSPTELLVTEANELFISDSGNHRVLYHNNTRFGVIPQGGGEEIKFTIGCAKSLIPGVSRPTKCAADKLFGKPHFNDFNKYSVETTGQSSLSYPTGLAIDDTDLLIADTDNNRVVKVFDYKNPNQYICNPDTWLTQLCQFRGLLGQGDYLTKGSFNDFFMADNSLLGGTFNNELQNAIISPYKPNNQPLWLGPSEEIFMRYFRNPTKIQIFERDGTKHLLVLANENFNFLTEVGTDVSMRSRILRFDKDPLGGASPKCNPGNFDSSPICLASEVIGQENFKKVVILSGSNGGTGSYSGSVFSLDGIDDMVMLGNFRLLALASQSNEVYTWHDVLEKEANGFPYNIKVLNPLGALLSPTQSLPNLKGITAMAYDTYNGKCYIIDSLDSKIFQLDFVNILGGL